MTEERLKKFPCTRCGTPAYSLCYIGKLGGRLVCVDCFSKACEKKKDGPKSEVTL